MPLTRHHGRRSAATRVSARGDPRPREFGKGAARRVRRAGRVPAVLHGHGTDTRHVTLPGHELLLA
jgi:large subunit ribosomal protein L25